jgi:hypothetical protein
MIKNVYWSACCSCPILMKLEFSRHIFEKCSNIKFYKIRSVGAELFHVDRQMDGRTDMTKLIVAFYNFAKAPKLRYKIPLIPLTKIDCL